MKAVTNPLMSVVRWVVIAYLGVCLAAYLMQRKLTYFPETATEPEMLKVADDGGQMIPLRTKGGALVAWETREGDPSRSVLIFHGNAGNALHRDALVRDVRGADPAPPQKPRKIVVLEYPGYGSRTGAPGEKSLVDAASELVAMRPGKVVLLGESLGTGVASAVAGLLPQRVKGVILLTPYNRLGAVASFHYPWLPVGLLMRDHYDSHRNLAAFPGPVAFLVAGEDKVIPPKFGLALYDGYAGKKRLWLIPGSGHNEAADRLGAIGWREVLDFVWR